MLDRYSSPEESLDREALQAYLAPRFPDVLHKLRIRQFPGGHSNLTYEVRIGSEEYVLRRPPLGPVPPKAHDMAREYRLLSRIAPLYSPAPKVVCLCEDPAVIGAPFYLMERRRGLILRDKPHPAVAGTEAEVSQAFIDALAQLHSVDIVAEGLKDLGRPVGFLERQVKGWSGRWEGAQTTSLPAMDSLSRWLSENLPESPPATIVHNDYKLDNVMLTQVPTRIAAVLDWEMTAVGDPLVDVGVSLSYWPQSDDPAPRLDALSRLTALPGWWPREQLLDRYHEKTGRDLSNIAYYEVFGLFKLAVVLQQIYYRYHVGQTSDERFSQFDRRVQALAEAASLLVQKL